MVPLKATKALSTEVEGPVTSPVVPVAEAISLTAPDEFLKYNFSSFVLRANSPSCKSLALGIAEAG